MGGRMRTRSDRYPYVITVANFEVRIFPRVIGWGWEVPTLAIRGGWSPTSAWAEASACGWLYAEMGPW